MTPTPVDALTARRLGLPFPLKREDLENARMAAVRRLVAHVQAASAWYRERLAGIDPASLRIPADLARLPLMSSTDVAGQGARMVCVSQSEVARIITLQTSGSTGAPKRLHFTRDDLAATVEFFLYGMLSMVSEKDRVLALLPFRQPDNTGDLLIRALVGGGIACEGCWPPTDWEALAARIGDEGFTCVVGLPQHALALAHDLPHGLVRTMLLCSDYAPPALRTRIETACGCETFLHYGTTETGLGGGVECAAHDGCHLRESDLLVEIVDPVTGAPVPDGVVGEVVVTTLGRQAMPLIRYRTGDLGRLERAPCVCGGVTARLHDILGRRIVFRVGGRLGLTSQDLDDVLFALDGLLDYRASLTQVGGRDRIEIEFLARSGHEHLDREIRRAVGRIPALEPALAEDALNVGIRRVAAFSPSHTAKRTILDQRSSE